MTFSNPAPSKTASNCRRLVYQCRTPTTIMSSTIRVAQKKAASRLKSTSWRQTSFQIRKIWSFLHRSQRMIKWESARVNRRSGDSARKWCSGWRLAVTTSSNICCKFKWSSFHPSGARCTRTFKYVSLAGQSFQASTKIMWWRLYFMRKANALVLKITSISAREMAGLTSSGFRRFGYLTI